jgi:hypothetical protein
MADRSDESDAAWRRHPCPEVWQRRVATRLGLHYPRGFAPRTPRLASSRGPRAPLRSPGSLASLVRSPDSHSLCSCFTMTEAGPVTIHCVTLARLSNSSILHSDARIIPGNSVLAPACAPACIRAQPEAAASEPGRTVVRTSAHPKPHHPVRVSNRHPVRPPDSGRSPEPGGARL